MRKLGLLLVVALLAAACSKVPTRSAQTPPAPDQAAQAPGGGTVRLLYPGKDPLMDNAIIAFHAKYPQYRVERVPVPAGADKQQAFSTVADMADVDLMIMLDTRAMVAAGQLLALDPYIARSRFDTGALGSGVEQLRIEGKLYDLPVAISPHVILYNKEMFQAAGVPLPRAGWTWDDFRSALTKLTAGNGESKVWGYDSAAAPKLMYTWILERAGGQPWTASDQHVREWLQFFATLVSTDKSFKPLGTDMAQGKGVNTGFAARRAAMTSMELDLFSFQSLQLPFQWDIAPVPVMPGAAGAAPATAYTLGIPAKAKNPDGAWAFLGFLCGPEGAAAVAKGGAVPLNGSPAARQAWFDRRPAPPPGSESLFATRWFFQDRTSEADVDRAASQAVTRILRAEAPWEKAAEDFISALQQFRANGR